MTAATVTRKYHCHLQPTTSFHSFVMSENMLFGCELLVGMLWKGERHSIRKIRSGIISISRSRSPPSPSPPHQHTVKSEFMNDLFDWIHSGTQIISHSFNPPTIPKLKTIQKVTLILVARRTTHGSSNFRQIPRCFQPQWNTSEQQAEAAKNSAASHPLRL